MPRQSNHPIVAIINSNQDIVEAIQILLSTEGYAAVTGHVATFKRGQEDIVNFFKEHDPSIIIYDIAPPYEENWNFFQLVKNLRELEGKKFVLTTTNKEALKKLVGESDVIEIIGKPFDLNEIVAAVKKKDNSSKNPEIA